MARKASPTALSIEPNATASQITVYPIPEVERGHNVADFPVHQSDWRDSIITFPADSGMAPLYIVLKEGPRQKAGVVTGYGADVVGTWLDNSRMVDGAPIPSRIADKLRGREFGRFDDFREALWLEVSRDPALMSQLSRANQANVRDGSAPFPVPEQQVGGRKTYEIHHIEQIQHGGAVYDIDNMRVLTPRGHINVYSNGRRQ